MKFYISILFLFFGKSLFAQFFVNPGALVETKKDAIITIQNMDAENQGDIFHAGDMEVTGNIINSNNWTCDPSISNRITLTLDWTNNSVFSPGIGRVEFNGLNQNIGGMMPTPFYNLVLNGVSGNVKTMLNNVDCLDSLYLKNVELATKGNVFALRNAKIPVQRNTGYISTYNLGSVKAVYSSAFSGNTEIPLGYGLGATLYKPIFLVNPAKDSFSFTLIGHSPNMDGRTSAGTLQDSLCSINTNYYYRVQTFGTNLFYGITKNSLELDYTKIGRWNGKGWDKISASGYTPSISVQNLAHNSQAALLNEYVSQAQEQPFIYAGQDLSVMPGSSAQLNATGFFPKSSTFLWNPDFDLSCSDCTNPIFTMGNPGIYTVTVSNGPNCIDTDTLIIIQNIDHKKLIANAFTPNSDKLNETFGPILLPGDELEKLEIYNRWGERLFDGIENWDGRYKGELVMQGVYVYLITISRNSGGYKTISKFSGDVTLLR